jgi:hypothetical protein
MTIAEHKKGSLKNFYSKYKTNFQAGNGMSMDKGGTSYMNMVDVDFPRDITVLQTTSHLQDETFKRADTKDGIYNHHNVFMDFARPPAPVGLRFLFQDLY